MSCGNCKEDCCKGCTRVVITKQGERGFGGPPGIQGEKGNQGAQGIQGPVGPSGTSGFTEYLANLSQTGVLPPSTQETRNTLGTVGTTYFTVGQYRLTSAGLFTANKTTAFISASAQGATVNTIMIHWVSVSEIWVTTYDITGATYADTILNNTSVHIIVED